MFQGLLNGLFQRVQLERFAQDPKLRCGRLHHVAVAAGEQDWNMRITIVDFLCQGNAVHATGHDDIAENKRDLLAPLQPVQSVGGIGLAQRLETELLKERRSNVGNLGVVLHHENRAVPRNNQLRGRRFGSFHDCCMFAW